MRFRTLLIPSVFLLGLLGACSQPPPPAASASAPAPAQKPAEVMPMVTAITPISSEADMIKNAMAAAPEAVSSDATVITMDEKMQIKTLRKGTNGWTCLHDNPVSPGIDPMCLDKNGTEWMVALVGHKDPPKGKMGFGYMLMGGSDASNTDPHAMTPKPGGQWVDTGPHVMVMNIGTSFDGYPTTPDNPKAPYVMFPNTPYAHLMLPVK